MITIKKKEDIAILREGGRRHAAIMRELSSMVREGVTAAELDKKASELISAGGDEAAFLNYKPAGAKRAYPASLCVSINEEIVHGIPGSDKVIREGDVVSLDLGLRHRGLITDMAVTVPVGNITPELSKLLNATREALTRGIKAAKGGRTTGDIGNAIDLVGTAADLGVVEELCGHGVGYGVHEDPYVPNYGDPGKGDRLVPGMVIAVEPIFTLGSRDIILGKDGYTYLTADGSLAAHFEHTILITKGNAEILTKE